MLLRIVLLCVFLQSAQSIERNHELKNAHATLSPLITTTETNDQTLFTNSSNVSSNDSAVNLKPNRRSLILKMFKGLFTTTKKPATEKNLEDISGLLQNLVVELNNLNKNLQLSKKGKYLSRDPKKPKRRHRIKRNVINNGNETVENLTNITAVNSNNVTSPNKNNTENEQLNNGYNVNIKTANNETNFNVTTTRESPLFLNASSTQSTDLTQDGRRSAILYQSSPILKQKLLIYLERMFYDIEHRIKPLTEIKILLADAISYRIGYIIANIDMLQVQLKKMQLQMAANKNSWSDSKVKELFNQVKSSGDVVSNLLDILSSYMPQSSQLNGKP